MSIFEVEKDVTKHNIVNESNNNKLNFKNSKDNTFWNYPKVFTTIFYFNSFIDNNTKLNVDCKYKTMHFVIMSRSIMKFGGVYDELYTLLFQV